MIWSRERRSPKRDCPPSPASMLLRGALRSAALPTAAAATVLPRSPSGRLILNADLAPTLKSKDAAAGGEAESGRFSLPDDLALLDRGTATALSHLFSCSSLFDEGLLLSTCCLRLCCCSTFLRDSCRFRI